MDLFQSILANIKQKLDKETIQIETVAGIASRVIGMTVTNEMIVMKGKSLTLKIPPTARAKLLIKRQQLLLALQKEEVDVRTIN